MEQYWIGEEHHTIRINEVDQSGFATFPACLNILQEVAWNNSQKLNFSVYEMQQRGVTWVVYRMQFNIKSYPKHYDKVIARSWPSGRDRLYTYRDYQLLNQDGAELIRGTSAWIVFDIEKRRPIPIPDFFKSLDFPENVEQMELDTSKIEAVKEKMNEHVVRYHDMDMNGHTNNANYTTWILEDLYQYLGEAHAPSYFDIIFKNETKFGEIISSGTKILSEGHSVHTLFTEDPHKTVAQASIRY